MDIDAQIKALEDQVAREASELDRARQARAAEQQNVAAAFGGAPQGDQQGQQQAFGGQQQQQQQQQTGEAGAQTGEKPPPRFQHDSDDRSIFIQGIPNHADITPEMLAEGFADCGPILKVTLLKNRQTGELKGGAYIEFGTHEAVGRALDTKQNITFRGSTLTVAKKRSMFNPGRGRGGRGMERGGRGRGGANPQDLMAGMMTMMMGAMAQMTRGGRGRGGRGGRGGQNAGGDSTQDATRGGRGGFKPF